MFEVQPLEKNVPCSKGKVLAQSSDCTLFHIQILYENKHVRIIGGSFVLNQREGYPLSFCMIHSSLTHAESVSAFGDFKDSAIYYRDF